MKESQLYLKADEVAKRFGVSVRTVRVWTREGHIPHYKVGRSVFYRTTELEGWMAGSRFVGHAKCPPLDGRSHAPA